MRNLIVLFVLVSLIIGCGEDNKPESVVKDVKTLQLDAQWAEAKTAVGFIKAMMDTYLARTGGDFTGLNLEEGFGPGSSLLVALRADDNTFSTLQYFDAEDFSVEILNDGAGANYVINVDASKGNGGTSGNGPKEGTGSYNSYSKKWTGKFK